MQTVPNVHRSLAAGRWRTLTLVEQFANIGSEVDRAIRAHQNNRVARRDEAITRALELFDLTAADERWRGPRRREVLRAREEFCRLFFANDAPPGSAESLSKYFLYFGIAARLAPTSRV
ncbi:MAG: hypothetical protein GEV06_14400 [Luteitalea sp.]|nr:hypothetical protein [Luteitalea sp.]